MSQPIYTTDLDVLLKTEAPRITLQHGKTITTLDHVVIGMLQQPRSFAARILSTLTNPSQLLLDLGDVGENAVTVEEPSKHVGRSAALVKAIEQSACIAQDSPGYHLVGTHHLLLAIAAQDRETLILQDKSSLPRLGISAAAIRAEISTFLPVTIYPTPKVRARLLKLAEQHNGNMQAAVECLLLSGHQLHQTWEDALQILRPQMEELRSSIEEKQRRKTE